jgi:Uma2 family endonuclease
MKEQFMSVSDPRIVLDPQDEVYPDTSLLVTEDGKPVDNLYVEKQYRLLTEPLWTSWTAPEGKPFRVLANVGLFFKSKEPPLVPDVMFALDVASPKAARESDNRSYFVWIVGKPPDIAIEIVSDKRGGEDTDKFRAYERIRVPFYVIYDPEEVLDGGALRAFGLHNGKYRSIDPSQFGDLGLGLTLWEGEYEQGEDTWLRWIDVNGKLIPTGKEKAENEKARAESAEERVKRLEERLRDAGLSTNGPT